jgi:hypothetical protein
MKCGRCADLDPSDAEELHVLVTADNDEDADKVRIVLVCWDFGATQPLLCC